MANDNPISHFLVAWTDEDGKPRYSKADPHRRADVHAGWTDDTITGKAKSKTSMGLYPKNKVNESTWGALDFDAHEHGQDELAKNRAIRAFTLIRHGLRTVIPQATEWQRIGNEIVHRTGLDWRRLI